MATPYSFLFLSVAFLSTLIEIKGTRWMDANPHAADWPNKIHHRNYDEARMSGDKRPLGKLATLAKDVENQMEARHFRNSKWMKLMKTALEEKKGKVGKKPYSKDTPNRKPKVNCGNHDANNTDTNTDTNVECGISNLNEAAYWAHHIVGGQGAERGMFPWQVGLSSYSDSLNIWCGGSYVIGNDGRPKVVTASHCISYEAMYGWDVYATFNLLDVNDPTGSVTWKVSKIIMHPDYDNETMENDVAILEFDEPLSDMPEGATPVCIASTPHVGGETAYVSGWGHTSQGGYGSDQLQYVEKRLLTLEDCQNTLYKDYEIKVTEVMICAGEEGIDSCQGDSGGPLVTENADGKWELIGVVSWGEGCGKAGYPGVYANVPCLYKWINDNI